MKKTIVLILAALLTACATISPSNRVRDPNSICRGSDKAYCDSFPAPSPTK